MFFFAQGNFTDHLTRQNDLRVFKQRVCSSKIKTALLARDGGIAGSTAQIQSADGSNIGVLSQSGLSSINLFVIATLMGRARAFIDTYSASKKDFRSG